jgi:hypothetical protein
MAFSPKYAAGGVRELTFAIRTERGEMGKGGPGLRAASFGLWSILYRA